ncbi:hypothetical protein ACTGY6_12875, partial [Streptococcus suis]
SGLANPTLVRTYYDHCRFSHKTSLPTKHVELTTQLSLLWSGTWQKQQIIQFLTLLLCLITTGFIVPEASGGPMVP